MSRPATSVRAQPDPTAAADNAPAAVLLRTFNDLRNELVSTLWFVLGNQEDAKDAAQEAFLRCWRTLHSIADVHNLRAWIFRVGLNVAKDVQRSAWRRRVKPLVGAETMPMVDTTPPTAGLENQECLQQLRQALLHPRPAANEGCPLPPHRPAAHE